MKKTLKIVACLLVMMTVALGMNVSKAHAVPILCDRSANPSCSAILEPGESTEIPLPGYKLKDVEIDFPGDAAFFPVPPPTVNYELDLGDSQVSGKIMPNITARYQFAPEYSGQGEIYNVKDIFALPLRVVWKNVADF